ncbi:hypothetical protein CAI16_15965 [Virgibacillus dokdonensis]|uniref:Gram-positive cocci surface proteins LPxTG domain-containing protein n=1 Tax=Virgibacillus dokdonensis TaxID=302167 RepID=A0A3E0WLI2_9BACI|nr:hypothetical protein CAI16_15965 [Virgibacillus dokdonensis]
MTQYLCTGGDSVFESCKWRPLFFIAIFVFSFFAISFQVVHAEQHNEAIVNEDMDALENREVSSQDEAVNRTNAQLEEQEIHKATDVKDSSLKEKEEMDDTAEGEANDKNLHSPVVHFEDEVLATLIAKQLGIKDRKITEEDMLDLVVLLDDSNSSKAISSIEGLQHAKNLEQLSLSNHQIEDISPLANLNNLFVVDLPGNKIKDISPLSNFKRIDLLHLSNNLISDITPLTKIDNLWEIGLRNNQITDITPITELPLMSMKIWLEGNHFRDDDTIRYAINHGVHVLGYNKDDVSYQYVKGWGICKFNEDKGGCDSYKEYHDIEKWLQVFPSEDGFKVDEDGAVSKETDQPVVLLNKKQLSLIMNSGQPLTIKNDNIQLTIPSSVFDNANEAVTIELKEQEKAPNSVSSTYSFTIKQGKRFISQFKPGITLTFNVDSNHADTDKLKVFYLNEKTENWENIGGTYQDGKVTAVTKHFSTFTVFESDESIFIAGDKEPTSTKDPTNIGGEGGKAEGRQSGEVSKASNVNNHEADSNHGDSAVNNKAKEETIREATLPNTATATYTWLLAGALFLLLGGIGLFFHIRRKKVN